MHAPEHRSTRRRAVALLAVAAVGAAVAFGSTVTADAAPDPTYVVRDGDTLSGVAARYGLTSGQLASANAVADPNLIHTGDRLVVPTGSTSTGTTSGAGASGQVHVVRDGESFWSIAHANGLRAGTLAAANRRTLSSMLHAGDRLTIPASTSGGSATDVPAGLVESGRIGMRPTFVYWANRNGISPALLQAVCYLESGWQHEVVSHTGAVGVCQLMPEAVDFASQLIGVDLDPRVPAENIRMSARTLRWLLAQTNGNERKALAAYYQGLAALRRSGAYPETVQYVNAVQALTKRF